jgi:hypothetical protein
MDNESVMIRERSIHDTQKYGGSFLVTQCDQATQEHSMAATNHDSINLMLQQFGFCFISVQCIVTTSPTWLIIFYKNDDIV